MCFAKLPAAVWPFQEVFFIKLHEQLNYHQKLVISYEAQILTQTLRQTNVLMSMIRTPHTNKQRDSNKIITYNKISKLMIYLFF